MHRVSATCRTWDEAEPVHKKRTERKLSSEQLKHENLISIHLNIKNTPTISSPTAHIQSVHHNLPQCPAGHVLERKRGFKLVWCNVSFCCKKRNNALKSYCKCDIFLCF